MKPWLLLPPTWAYQLAPLALKLHTKFSQPKAYEWRSFHWQGLYFPNRLGTSGGVDKNAEHILDWWSFGVGFQELGTVTPLGQDANPGTIIDRNSAQRAVWNKMGFPNLGSDVFLSNINLTRRPYLTPLFINIGKNRNTPIEKAHEDYILGVRKFHSAADAFVINISSPNTSGLRDLLKKDNLKNFLDPIVACNLELSGAHAPKPLLLKLSPDQSLDELETTLDTSCSLGLDGWILTNTTTQLGRKFGFPDLGGVSGAPLAPTSKQLLKAAVEILGKRRSGKLLVSSGGVLSSEDVMERLELGADLVQVYAALIFEGPQFFSQVARFAVQR